MKVLEKLQKLHSTGFSGIIILCERINSEQIRNLSFFLSDCYLTDVLDYLDYTVDRISYVDFNDVSDEELQEYEIDDCYDVTDIDPQSKEDILIKKYQEKCKNICDTGVFIFCRLTV